MMHVMESRVSIMHGTVHIHYQVDYIVCMIMIIAPNSRTPKGEKERREVKGEYG